MADYGDPIGVSELAKIVGANKPRTFRHLRTLVDRDYVAQDAETDKYFELTLLFEISKAASIIDNTKPLIPYPYNSKLSISFLYNS